MNGRPQDFMSVGIIHFMAFPEVGRGEGPIVETLKTLCDDEYFQVIEVTAVRDAAVRQQAIQLVARFRQESRLRRAAGPAGRPA